MINWLNWNILHHRRTSLGILENLRHLILREFLFDIWRNSNSPETGNGLKNVIRRLTNLPFIYLLIRSEKGKWRESRIFLLAVLLFVLPASPRFLQPILISVASRRGWMPAHQQQVGLYLTKVRQKRKESLDDAYPLIVFYHL